MKLMITLRPGEAGKWVAECPAIPGCVSEGTRADEAAANVREAIEACLEARADLGLPLTIETRQVDVAV